MTRTSIRPVPCAVHFRVLARVSGSRVRGFSQYRAKGGKAGPRRWDDRLEIWKYRRGNGGKVSQGEKSRRVGGHGDGHSEPVKLRSSGKRNDELRRSRGEQRGADLEI